MNNPYSDIVNAMRVQGAVYNSTDIMPGTVIDDFPLQIVAGGVVMSVDYIPYGDTLAVGDVVMIKILSNQVYVLTRVVKL